MATLLDKLAAAERAVMAEPASGTAIQKLREVRAELTLHTIDATHPAEPPKEALLWECDDCGELVDDGDQYAHAAECCSFTPVTVFGCPVCGEDHRVYADAVRCCAVEAAS